MRPFRCATLLALAALLLPAVSLAAAPPPLVPPGVSGANQYTETLPGPGGNEPTSGAKGQGPKSPAKALGKGNAKRLESLGPEGRAAAQLAAVGATNDASRLDKSGKDSGGQGSPASGNGTSGVGQVLGHLTGTSDSGGMGALLGLLIGAAAIAAGAFVFLRRRAGQTQS
jgi:hypothetical protein